MDRLFDGVRNGALAQLSTDAPIVVAMDDTILRKTGHKAGGVAYRRDPLSPPFHVNFIRGQKVLQLSIAIPNGKLPTAARAIPIDFYHCPTPKKPKKHAPEEQWRIFYLASRILSLSRQGARRLKVLRDSLDTEPGDGRPLVVVVDGRFTNKIILKNLPDRTTLIGRIRKDAKLYHVPETNSARGRRRVYGRQAPTPEQLRQDPDAPWQTVPVFAAGRVHAFKVKTLCPLRWRTAGERITLRLVVIAPLRYRPRKGARLLYREPAYLLCTDPDMPLQHIIQRYVWRWDIEVNFRDEKTVLGVGQAQVRTEPSVELAPALTVAAYATLLLAAHNTLGANGVPGTLPPPKWRANRPKQRASTQDLINHLRGEMWGKAMGHPNFSGFSSQTTAIRKPEKFMPQLESAVLYAQA